MRIAIITSCTGEKTSKPDKELTLDDFRQGSAHIRARQKELKPFIQPAQTLYTGEQHIRLMRGVEVLQSHLASNGSNGAVDLSILSAGYGLIKGSKRIAPYECTFTGMRSKELREWADHLKVPQGIQKALPEPYDLGLILLGDTYLKACALSAETQLGGPTLLFCGKIMAKRLPDLPHLRTVVLSNKDAKHFRCGLIGLKGELAQRICQGLTNGKFTSEKLMSPKTDVLDLLGKITPIPRVKAKPKPSFRANPKVDKVIRVSKAWWNKKHREKLQYFIPDWDDMVDPDYDFIKDEHSGGKGNWANQVYAHQMYPTPNYDGILVSRAVAEFSKEKTQRINSLGVHRFLRVPRELPLMGDCGAFDYIKEEVPPYSTEDVLDYYTRLDFDYGVSVDHLIVSFTADQKKFRYDLTIQNAEDFIKEHRKAKLDWEPIGAVQGWDPQSYARAAEQYVKMGYQYIALGGLVRSTSKEILHTVAVVREKVPASVKLHVFGIARLDAMNALNSAGADSVDSASHLRRAWLGAGKNYSTLGGKSYTAIRIPQADKSFRAKRMVSEGRASLKKVQGLEEKCLKLVRDYDRGKAKKNSVLDVLCDYDELVAENRVSIRPLLDELLTDKPWKACPCDICQKDGIEVVIFRGNNRNRRRGFHNTYVFYNVLQEILNTGQMPEGFLTGGNKGQLELFDASGD